MGHKTNEDIVQLIEETQANLIGISIYLEDYLRYKRPVKRFFNKLFKIEKYLLKKYGEIDESHN